MSLRTTTWLAIPVGALVLGLVAAGQDGDALETARPASPIDGETEAGATAAYNYKRGNIPVGTIVAYGGPIAPEGWLRCDGSYISIDENKALFHIIFDSFGMIDAKNGTFALPDLRARYLIGRDMEAGDSIGAQFGGRHEHRMFDFEVNRTLRIHEQQFQEINWGSYDVFEMVVSGMPDDPIELQIGNQNLSGPAQIWTLDPEFINEQRPASLVINYIIKR